MPHCGVSYKATLAFILVKICVSFVTCQCLGTMDQNAEETLHVYMMTLSVVQKYDAGPAGEQRGTQSLMRGALGAADKPLALIPPSLISSFTIPGNYTASNINSNQQQTFKGAELTRGPLGQLDRRNHRTDG